MVKQAAGEADDCPPPFVPSLTPPPAATTKTVPWTVPSSRYGNFPGFPKGTLCVPSGAKLKAGNALATATIACCRVPRLVQSTLPPSGTDATDGLSAPSAIVTEGLDAVAPSRTSSAPTHVRARTAQPMNM